MGKVVKIIGLYFQSLGKKNLIRRKSFGSNFLFKPTIHLFGHNEFDGFPNVLPCGIRAVMDCTKSQTGKPVVLNNIFISFVKFNTLNFLNFFSKVTVFKLAFPQRMKIRAVKKHPTCDRRKITFKIISGNLEISCIRQRKKNFPAV